ncbi:GAF domain-containing sensor histidine kinase [Intrasporangium flavum]|uniref:GAF domain-containing sensor histidine kinase n=1 Tax=Intrasporangium flavum TaxID=1428657 RepID=UPI001A9639BD|nr:GAF domain-containing sensor histidine kinase [Intrasporangium flavum]
MTAISEDLELSEVLQRIVRSACALVNARYGALGVLGPDGEHLMQFITHGVTAEQRARIGDPPSGHGILGLLIRDPQPRRLTDISAHPDSHGFPPGHPSMTSFLGAPIRIRDHVFGNLYLAERQGQEEFSEADEAMLVALAGAAGFAIDNARLYARSQQQRLWAQSVNELTQSLLEGHDEEAALMLVAKDVCRITDARTCLVALRDQGTGTVRVRALHESDPTEHQVPWRSWPALETEDDWPTSASADQVLPGPRPAEPLPATLLRLVGADHDVPVAFVTISTGQRAIGHLLVHWRVGEDDAPGEAMPMLSLFARQAALGLVAARAQEDRQHLAMLEERDRIARDMHDHVIQRLFATGLSLQAAARLAMHPVVRSRLDEAVTSLDEAIKVIRSTIFELHTVAPGGSLVDQLENVVTSWYPTLGFLPVLDLDGEPDEDDEGLRADVLAVVRESLANVSRHAEASTATVRVDFGEVLTVEVTDDGVGMGSADRRSGLANLEHRAAARSGELNIEGVEPHGTRVRWTVPLGPPATLGRPARRRERREP